MLTFITYICGELDKSHKDKIVILSGWIYKKRDHGNLLFIDLRDNYGISQCVIEKGHKSFSNIEKTSLETVVKIEGLVLERSSETINKDLKTGEIEISINSFEILGSAKELPLPVFLDEDYSEDIRLKYRYLDLRRKRIHRTIISHRAQLGH